MSKVAGAGHTDPTTGKWVPSEALPWPDRRHWTGHIGPDAAKTCKTPQHWMSNVQPLAALEQRDHEPEQVMVPMYKCTVCEELFRNRSQLDHDGRCDECRP